MPKASKAYRAFKKWYKRYVNNHADVQEISINFYKIFTYEKDIDNNRSTEVDH